MPLAMNLEKIEESKTKLVANLQKAGILTPPPVELAIDLDVSGSFEDEHEKGLTNDLLTRLVPWGLAFDPDKKLDVFTFSDGASSVYLAGSVTTANYTNFVRREIFNKVPGWNGSTDYSYPLEANLRHFGWIDNQPKKAGFFGKMFGQKDQEARARKRSLVIMITDGDNYDKSRTEQVLRDSEARGDQVYFLFLGVSNQGSKFPFLERIGDKFGNTGFVHIKDLRRFVELSDEELNDLLLSDELIEWLKN